MAPEAPAKRTRKGAGAGAFFCRYIKAGTGAVPRERKDSRIFSAQSSEAASISAMVSASAIRLSASATCRFSTSLPSSRVTP